MNIKTPRRVALQKEMLGCLKYHSGGLKVREISDIICPKDGNKDEYYEKTHRMMYRIIEQLEKEGKIEYIGGIRHRKLLLKSKP
jgi:hypothetical protein